MLSRIKIKRAAAYSVPSAWKRLSLRRLKVVLAGILACHAVFFLFLWQPAYDRFYSLKEDKLYWQHVLMTEVTDPYTIIPDMDQLPNMIEQCRGAFIKEGVDVVSFNVERFGERTEAGKGARIDYALVRLRLLGQGQGILNSLKELEENQGLSIHVQEVALADEGGDTLLQIYFKTGD